MTGFEEPNEFNIAEGYRPIENTESHSLIEDENVVVSFFGHVSSYLKSQLDFVQAEGIYRQSFGEWMRESGHPDETDFDDPVSIWAQSKIPLLTDSGYFGQYSQVEFRDIAESAHVVHSVIGDMDRKLRTDGGRKEIRTDYVTHLLGTALHSATYIVEQTQQGDYEATLHEPMCWFEDTDLEIVEEALARLGFAEKTKSPSTEGVYRYAPDETIDQTVRAELAQFDEGGRMIVGFCQNS